MDSDAAARIEFPEDGNFARIANLNYIVEDAVHYFFVEAIVIAKSKEVHLEGLALNTFFVGYIANRDMTKIGLAGHRAKSGEFGARKLNYLTT